MNEGSNPTPSSSGKSRSLFLVGCVLLFVMALTWSLDDSFVYMSLGAAVFFFFLAYYNRERTLPHHSRKSRQRSHASGLADFFEGVGGFSRKSSRPRSQPQHIASGRRFAIVVFFLMGSMALFVVLSIFFADDSSGDELNDAYNKAESARYAGNYDSAEYYYQKMLAAEPENLDALNGLGIVSLEQQRYDKAIARFDDALKTDPDYEYARYNKALTLFYKKDYRRSLGETFYLLERSPDYYDAMQLAGDNYYDQQRYDSAQYWYDEGYSNGLRNAWICHVLGYLYDRGNDTQRAAELYREALNYDSTKIDVYVRLGEIYPGPDGDFYRTKVQSLKQGSR